MLIDKKGVDDVIDILNPEVFYKKQHQLIYQAIFELFNQSEAIDLLTVAEQLRRTGNLEAAGVSLPYQPYSTSIVVCQCRVSRSHCFTEVYQAKADRNIS